MTTRLPLGHSAKIGAPTRQTMRLILGILLAAIVTLFHPFVRFDSVAAPQINSRIGSPFSTM